MTVQFYLVGYDKKTERMVLQCGIPFDVVPIAKRIAHLDIADDTQIGDWELDASQARDIAGLIHASIDTARQDFFLEPYPVH